MPRWKTPRWTLGVPALVALAVAGCGAAASRPRLHSSSEKRLLSLVARARTDASTRNGPAVHADLGEFVSDVKTLTTSGQISRATAGKLDRQARATAAQAVEQLPRTPASAATTATTATTVTQAAGPSTTTTPATGHPTPPAQHTPPPPHKHDQGPGKTPPPPKHDQGPGGGRPDPVKPGPGHEHGHGHGGRSSSQNAAGWWSYVIGGGGD